MKKPRLKVKNISLITKIIIAPNVDLMWIGAIGLDLGYSLLIDRLD